MKRLTCLVAVVFVGASLLAAVGAAAAPLTPEAASLKAAADETLRSFANWHLNTLGKTVYDRYETNVHAYQVVGDMGFARGAYTIVSRSRCGTVGPCTRTGVFQTVFEKQGDGSWKFSSYTMIPEE